MDDPAEAETDAPASAEPTPHLTQQPSAPLVASPAPLTQRARLDRSPLLRQRPPGWIAAARFVIGLEAVLTVIAATRVSAGSSTAPFVATMLAVRLLPGAIGSIWTLWRQRSMTADQAKVLMLAIFIPWAMLVILTVLTLPPVHTADYITELGHQIAAVLGVSSWVALIGAAIAPKIPLRTLDEEQTATPPPSSSTSESTPPPRQDPPPAA